MATRRRRGQVRRGAALNEPIRVLLNASQNRNVHGHRNDASCFFGHPLAASMRRRLNSIHVSISSISCVCNAGLFARLCVLARFQQMRAEILREITIQAIRPIRPHMTCWNVRPPQSLHSLHSLFSSFHFRFHFLNLCNFAGMQDGLFLRQRIAWQDLLAGHRSVESVENYFVNARERCVEEDALSDAETEFAFE